MIRAIRPEGLAISVVVYGEVMNGILHSDNQLVDLNPWRSFLAGVDILDFTLPLAEAWAQIRGDLRKEQQMLPDNDLMIAATAMRFGMCLVSHNLKDFGRIAGLDLLVPDSA